MDIELLLVVVAERPLEAARPPSEWSFQVPPRLLRTPREIDPWPRGAGWVDTLHEMGSGAVLFLSVTSTPTQVHPISAAGSHVPPHIRWLAARYLTTAALGPDPTQPNHADADADAPPSVPTRAPTHQPSSSLAVTSERSDRSCSCSCQTPKPVVVFGMFMFPSRPESGSTIIFQNGIEFRQGGSEMAATCDPIQRKRYWCRTHLTDKRRCLSNYLHVGNIRARLVLR